jgi:hypothetical protein
LTDVRIYDDSERNQIFLQKLKAEVEDEKEDVTPKTSSSFQANVTPGKCHSGKMSLRANVAPDKCHSGKISLRANFVEP